MEKNRQRGDLENSGADTRRPQKKNEWAGRAYQALPAAVLLGMLVFFGLWQAVSLKRTYSPSERRLLASRPVPTKESVLDTSFMSAYEDYLTDQFPMRDRWITMKTYCGLLLGRRESGGVYIAGDRSMIELHMPEIAEGETAERNVECLTGFLKDMKEAGAGYVRVMLVPTADGIWKEKLSPYAEPFEQQEYLEAFVEMLSGQGLSDCYVDVWAALAAHAGEPVYYKTDHHWTMQGAYFGYEAYAHSLSAQGGAPERVYPWAEYQKEVVRTDFHGTTAAKCGLYHVDDEIVLVYPPERDGERFVVKYDGGEAESDSLYEYRHAQGDDPYSIYLDGNHAMTQISVMRDKGSAADQEQGRSLLLIKDSYANSFVPYLTGLYDEITMIDLRYYNGSMRALMEEHPFTDVLVLYNLPNFLTETTVYRLGK